MHLAPSMRKVIDQAQVEFVCASGVFKLRRAAFLKEGDLAVDANGSK
jgi:hypothetical protein